MFVDHKEVKNFMFNLNKKARSYLESNIITVQNGFINEGLITHQLIFMDLTDILLLERLYFQALTRNIRNRILNLEIKFDK
jgi:hypothetical protein